MPLYSNAERLSLALAAAKLGDWDWDISTDMVTLSQRAAEIFEIPVGPYMTWTAMRRLLHPDDAERAREAVERSLETRTDYDIEYRLINGSSERWVSARGRGVYDDHGAVVGMLGVVQDITEQVRTREALRGQAEVLRGNEERYRAFIANSSEGIWRLEFSPPVDTSLPVDEQVAAAYANGRLAECNMVMARMYGLNTPEDLVGKTIDFMLPSSDPAARAYLASIIEAGYRVSDVESKERDAQGNVAWFSNSMIGEVIDGRLHRMWGTQRDISANKALYAAAQEASRLKDDFLASLSHELRTPLNAILGYARMLRTGVLAPERHGKAIDTIERNATSLTQIVEDVLDISRIVSGRIRLDMHPVELPEIVKNAIDAVTPAADARGVRLEAVLDPLAAPVSGDTERLQQILWNILANAVKFTGKGGKVEVRLERANSHVEVSVSDTGIGISPEFLPHVFERFRQADGGTDRERGGLGLGLSIAKQLTEMHGGTIGAASEGVGRGATFRVTLPLMIVHRSGDAPERVLPRASSGARAIPAGALHGIHVLTVDDDADAVSLVAQLLESAGAQVTTAASAEEALDHLERNPPSLLLSDLGMPRVDGFKLIEQVRRHPNPAVSRIPAAALTAYARSDDRVKTLRAGFQTHLSKPIDPAELVATIAALVKRFPRDETEDVAEPG